MNSRYTNPYQPLYVNFQHQTTEGFSNVSLCDAVLFSRCQDSVLPSMSKIARKHIPGAIIVYWNIFSGFSYFKLQSCAERHSPAKGRHRKYLSGENQVRISWSNTQHLGLIAGGQSPNKRRRRYIPTTFERSKEELKIQARTQARQVHFEQARRIQARGSPFYVGFDTIFIFPDWCSGDKAANRPRYRWRFYYLSMACFTMNREFINEIVQGFRKLLKRVIVHGPNLSSSTTQPRIPIEKVVLKIEARTRELVREQLTCKNMSGCLNSSFRLWATLRGFEEHTFDSGSSSWISD